MSGVTANPVATVASGRRHPMAWFVVKRIATGVLVLFVASFLIFAAMQALRGDVAGAVLGRNATPEAENRLRADLNLDDPFLVRYGDWISGVATGDLGNSSVAVAQGSPDPAVWSSIEQPLVNSLILAVICLVLLVPLGLIFGSIAAVRAGRAADHGISFTSLIFGALPEFLVATFLILIFFTATDLLPAVSTIGPDQSPFADPPTLVLPVLALLLVSLSGSIRMIRASTIQVLRQDYVTMARLSGQPEGRVLWRYAIRNSLGPSVQILAQTAQYLIGGVIVIESVFNYPGIGKQLISAVSTRDVQVTCDIALILAAIYVTVNVVADLVTLWLVPKLRTEVLE